MKVLVGKRNKPIAKPGGSLERIKNLGEMMGATIQSGPVITIGRVGCPKCKKIYDVIIREDAYTGEVWAEGPEKCECEFVFEYNGTPPKMNQEQIENLFGKH